MTTTIDTEFWDHYRSLVPKGQDPTEVDFEAAKMRVKVIEEFIYLTKRVVGKMKKSMPAHVERDELESWASIGLLQAVQRYNHELGVPFEAFATQRMRSVIMDGIRDADWAPRSLRKKQRDITKAEDVLKQALGRAPLDTEVAERLGISSDEVSATKYKGEIASHTYIESSIEAQTKTSSLDSEEDELVHLLKIVVAEALDQLPIRQAAIVALHYYEELNLSDIAVLLNTSLVRIGALHQEAILSIWEHVQNALKNV